MKIQITFILTSSLVACIYADCYRQNFCADRGKGVTFGPGQTWTPLNDPCYSCKCNEQRRYVLACQEPVRQAPVARSGTTSAFFEKLFDLPDPARDKEVEISKDDAKSVICKPVPGPIIDWTTWTFEYPVLRNVYFYYKELHSQCCNRYLSVQTADPSCKVVRVSRCSSKLVRRDNPTQPCDAPQYYRG